MTVARTPIIALIAALLAVATPLVGGIERAQACSIEGRSQDASLPPANDLTLGPLPVFLSVETPTPRLTRDGDVEPIPVVRVDTFELVDFHRSADVHAWRPVAPLEAGHYSFGGGLEPYAWATQTFFVDPELVDPPPTLERAGYHVTLDDPDEDEGMSCAGESSSCDDIDFSKITIEFSAAESVAGALIAISFPSRDLSTLVFTGSPLYGVPDPNAPGLLRRTVGFTDAFGDLPASFKATSVCVAITPVSENGTLGERTDLGCSRPDEDDPRVTDTRSCATAQTTDLGWFVLALLFIIARRARWRAAV